MKNLRNNVKYEKSAWIRFVPINVPNFMPNFRKIRGAVSEKQPLQTDGRTDGGDFIGPFGFQPGTKKFLVFKNQNTIKHL